MTFLVMAPLVLANEKVKLPDYKKWSVDGPYSSTYGSIQGCNSKQTMEEISKLAEKEYNRLDLTSYQYSLADKDIFVDLIENIKGDPWIILYHDEEINHFFKRERFFIFGHRWTYVDSLSEDASDELIISFQVRNCLFFPFK